MGASSYLGLLAGPRIAACLLANLLATAASTGLLPAM